MQIQVMGTGCKTCKTLYEHTKQAVSELHLDADVEYITDVKKIISMGFLKSPILMVDGRAVKIGGAPTLEEIKMLIQSPASRAE